MSDTDSIRTDEPGKIALARLTANEKECLRRRLLPQTAKEMASDLGISPHAVEKRLKMARAKLGVSSSLAAARLLAASEGDQLLVPIFRTFQTAQTNLKTATSRCPLHGHRAFQKD
jgi:DNA-binding CsgD family transcriptional regulator